jgi:serine/threonine-protein kinase
VVAGYRLEEQIGRGGMAVVYRAHDERLDRQVALKILAPVLAADQAFRQRFIAESRAAAAVDDPNIIPVYEAGESDGVLFIAMRLVRGGDLKTLVGQHGPLSATRAEWILSAVASALDAAHAAGLVHRDVKPANMLLETRAGRPDHVYLSDFGVSKAALETVGLTGSGQFVGTVDYAAPEQIQDREVDGRTDQYALGCSAFELLCGQPPFFGKQLMAGMFAHVSEPPPPPTSLRPELPAAVDAVFGRVLAKSPADRYGTCQDFAAALAAALGLSPYVPDGLATAGQGQAGGAEEDDATLAPSGAPAAGSRRSTRPGTEPLAVLNGAGGGPPGTAAATDHAGASLPDGRRRTRRLVRLGALGAALLVAAGAAAAFLLPGSAASSVTYQFAARHFAGGLTLGQDWTLAGAGGSRLDVRISAANSTAAAITAQLEEPVPRAVAASLPAVRFHPAAKLLIASRMAVWDLRLPAGQQVAVSYQVRLPAEGVSEARLAALTSAFAAVAGRQVLEPIPPGGVLQSVVITPASPEVSVGGTVRLGLRGTLSTGRPAAAADLAGAVWSTADAAVAAVTRHGRIVGEAAGVTIVTVRVGLISDSVLVTVGSGAAPTGGSSPPPGQGGTSPSPTPSVSPTVSPSTSGTPSTSPSPSPSTTPPPTPTPTATQAAGSAGPSGSA